MRRKDRERDAEFAWRVFETAPYATLSTVNAEGAPCCVPISPARIDDALYFHCALAGEKLDNLTRHPSVCLSAVSRTEIIGEKLTVGYDSAVMHGKAKIVTEPQKRKEALRAIAERYCPDQMGRFAEEFDKYACQTVVVRIDPETITGKSNSKE